MKRARAFYLNVGKWYADASGGEYTSFLRYHSKQGDYYMFDKMVGFQSSYIFENGMTGFTAEQEFYSVTTEDVMLWDLDW